MPKVMTTAGNRVLEAITQTLSRGLTKQSSSTCSQWALNYIVLGKPKPGPFSYKWHPWTYEMHDCNGDWVGMKAAQMGYTQTALDRALFSIDINRTDVLYILPKRTPDAADFSKAKFDSLLDLSPHVAAMFSNVRNIGHKQAGAVNLYIRGGRSRSGLKTISTGVKIYDEYDEMIQKNVALAEERSSGFDTEDKQTIKLSTPTIPEFGISQALAEANEEHYFFTCPRCGRKTEFIYPDCLVITAESLSDPNYKKSYYQCKECKGRIEQEEKPSILDHRKAKWEIVQNRQSDTRGFQIPQLYSTVLRPHEIARQVLRARSDSNYEQELWNSKLGLPYVPKGARVEDWEFNACRMNYSMAAAPPRNRLITMGVDVGHHDLYCEIAEWLLPTPLGLTINVYAKKRVLKVCIVHGFDELDTLVYGYQVLHTIIDIAPAFREANNFCDRHRGHANLCQFVRGIEKNSIKPLQNEDEYVVRVNRTAWLDISQSRFKKNTTPGGIILPMDIPEQYKEHIQALTRILKPDEDGNLKARYISIRPDDHFAFASVYNDIALPMAVSQKFNTNIHTLT